MPPWTRVALIDRAIAGENRRVLETEFGVHRATINRWVAKWGNARKQALGVATSPSAMQA
jgi:transposase